MKIRFSKTVALILSAVLLITLMWQHGDTIAEAAVAPTFTETKVAMVGEGSTHQLEIKDKVTGSTYKWSSSNTKVAKVSSKGLVTSVNKGTAIITCKITLPTKKTKSLTSKITVTIPATELKINNAVEVNGAHILAIGESFDFNNDIVPANSSDIVYWAAKGGDESCIRVDDSANGKVTALKAGKVILMATAAKSTSSEDLKNSIINDAIIIEVKGQTATVNSADIISSTEIKVVFDSPIDTTTVIGTNGTLLDSIEVTLRKNVKGVLAKDPGALKASLSTDLKTLTITSANIFDGEYGINFTSKIKTTGGIAIEEYYKQISYIDTNGPSIKEVALDDTGFIATILFSEPIDMTNFKVSNVTLVPTSNSGTTADPTTLSTLNNRLNYVLSTDKKALTINLSRIANSDYGKIFIVTFTGIKDLMGNSPSTYTLTTNLYTDNTLKPQARPLMIARTGYNTLTVTFDRSIQTAGYAQINNGALILGVVDSKDTKKVNYNMTDAEAILTGYQTVDVMYWNGYNVNPLDSATTQRFRFNNVDFAADKTSPVLLSYEFNAETNVLTLTYNESVTLTSNTGVFSSTLTTLTDEIMSGTNISYTKMESTDSKVIKLLMGNMTLIGTYNFRLETGFVIDSFRNFNLPGNMTISNSNGTGSELPGPFAITQSTTNLSQIYLEFSNMLDVASATNVANYSIPGVTILSAQVSKNTKNNGATVILTVADGSITVTVERPIAITGVKGYNGSFTAIEAFNQMVMLKDNQKPTLLGSAVFDKTTLNTIKLNFSEAIAGTMTVKVTQIGTYPVEIPNTVSVSGSTAIITLGSIPTNGAYLRIDVIDNKITDTNGNQVSAMPTQLGALVSYQ